MEEVEVDGVKVVVQEDSEVGTTTRILKTNKYELRFPYGAEDILKEKLKKQNKDGTLKYDEKHKEVAMQDFILNKMHKIKDELLDKGDFWTTFQAYKKVIFEEKKPVEFK